MEVPHQLKLMFVTKFTQKSLSRRHEADARRRAAPALPGRVAQALVRRRPRHQDSGQFRRGGRHRAQKQQHHPHQLRLQLCCRFYLEIHLVRQVTLK